MASFHYVKLSNFASLTAVPLFQTMLSIVKPVIPVMGGLDSSSSQSPASFAGYDRGIVDLNRWLLQSEPDSQDS